MADFEIRADEVLEDEELENKIEQAEQRMHNRPIVWIPEKGEMRAVKVLDIQTDETEIGLSKFFILLDLRSKQRLKLIAHASLENNIEKGKLYLLQYQGKQYVSKLDRECHSWLWEEIK